MFKKIKRKKQFFFLGIVIWSVFLAGCSVVNDTSLGKKTKNEAEIIQKKLNQRIVKKPLKIGVITDAHFYGKKVNDQWEMNWRSREAMERFVEKMNNDFHPDLVVEIGDLVDGKDHNALMDWKIADRMMSKLKMPYYHTIGNHEMRSFTKKTWLELTGYKKPYYFKDIDGYRIIILDGNHLPGGKDTSPEKEYYPGALGLVQWEWLDGVLKEAVMQDKDPVVFLHQPPLRTDAKPNWELFPKGEKLHRLFDKYGVRGVFSGHIERLCDVKDGLTEYFVLQGFWKANRGLKKEYRFKDGGNFYYVTIAPDKITVQMEYRVFGLNKDKQSDKRYHQISHWENLTLNPTEHNCLDRKRLRDDNDSGLLIKNEANNE